MSAEETQERFPQVASLASSDAHNQLADEQAWACVAAAATGVEPEDFIIEEPVVKMRASEGFHKKIENILREDVNNAL